MLGCIGVAPPQKQALRAGYLVSWDGNMDYSSVREGVAVYPPVYQEVAILFLGDGHALEGGGELNRDALETSKDVEFQVELVKGFRSNAPSFENADSIIASGIVNSLQDALQQATTELARWLERDYQLNANESNIVLGSGDIEVATGSAVLADSPRGRRTLRRPSANPSRAPLGSGS